MAGKRNEGGRTRALTLAERARPLLTLSMIGALLTLIARALLS